MIYRVLYDGIDIHTNSVPDVLINPTVETEMNTAGSFTFTLPPDHFAWGDIYVFKGNVEVYENNDLIFFGRVANVDQNWNNERVVECEGALAFFNDSIQRPNSWTSNTLISKFLSDILDNHNAQVPDNRKIYLGNVTIDDMYVTRETNYEKTLDVLTRMCIDTNGGYFSLRKDENDGKIYLDWLKDLTDIAAQPVEFGLNLLDISRSLHAEDICTGVLARGGEVNDVKIDLHEVREIDDPSIPVIHHTNLDPDILWHREGLEGYGRVVQVKEFNDCTTVDGDNGLLAKATEWLIKQNTDIDTIEVDAAELGYFGESYPIFLLGQKVVVNSHPHHLENVELPMYKISMNLDSGTKRISIGTPPKRELTQISASNMGGGSGSSSSGGGSGSGGVQDVRVNGTSVVQDGIANVSVPTDTVTESEMSTAISTAVSGKADKTEIPEIEANPTGTATDTLTSIDINGTKYDIQGGGVSDLIMMSDFHSEEETVVGRWIDGKPLYERTYVLRENGVNKYTIGGLQNREYQIGLTGTERNMITKMFLRRSDGNWDDSRNISSEVIVTFNRVSGAIYCYETHNPTDIIMVIQYTKTTDAPGTGPTPGNLIYLPALYSEEEREVGAYIDGKPLYQRTYILRENGVDKYQLDYGVLAQIGLTGADKVWLHSFYADRRDGSGYIDSAIIPNEVIFGGYYQSDGSIYFQSTHNPANIQVTLRYTKTTDQPGSGTWTPEGQLAHHYSTSEKIVGTWIDGSTIYERTWDLGSDITVSPNSWLDTSIVRGNINRIISYDAMSSEGANRALDVAFDSTYIQVLSMRSNNDVVRYLTLRYTKSS